MIPCPVCSKTCQNSQGLDRHIATHTKEKPYHCPLCSAAFGRQSTVYQHVRLVHDGMKPVRNRNSHCHMCSYKACSKAKLQEHLRKHFPEQPFSCTIISCKFKTKYKTNLWHHIRTAHNDEKPFECPSGGCSYKTKTRQQLKSHLKIHSNEKPFACEFAGCSYKCKIRGSLKVHTVSAHMDEKPFVCLTCGFRSKIRQNLIQHQQRVHTKIKRFQCQLSNCSYASYFRRDVKQHFDRKHRTKDVLCTEPGCHLKFGSVTLLNRHLKIHAGQTYKCPRPSCNFSTKYKKDLPRHISRHDAKNSVTLRCDFPNCGYQTKFPYHYDLHTKGHKSEKKRDHVCSICLYRCSHLCQLRAHIQRHLGEKPYSCSYCKYTAVSSIELSKHVTTSHKIRVVPNGKKHKVRKCRTCGKNCLSYHDLVLHSLSHLQPVVVLERLHIHVL